MKFTQTYVHRVGDAIQPSHPLLSPSSPTFNLSQHQCLFKRVSSSHWWPEYRSFSFSIIPSKLASTHLLGFHKSVAYVICLQGFHIFRTEANIPIIIYLPIIRILCFLPSLSMQLLYTDANLDNRKVLQL